jgi:hypothetical protein
MARSGITTTSGQLSHTSVCSLLLWESFQTTLAIKGLANKNKIALATVPGQNVSVDQMQSTVPGMVGLIKGVPTQQRYQFATVLVDQFSGLSFIHLQKTSSGEETLDAKMAFEGFVCSLNVQIQHYHANNGCFCKNMWMGNIKKEGQTISFFGVSALFQNGVTER